MNKPSSIINPHRFARLIAWAQAMLAWVALALFSNTSVNRRYIRQRYRFLSLGRLERFVRAAAIVRAMEITRMSAGRRAARNTAPSGFRRRIVRGAMMRAIAGSRFRKAIKHRDLRERLLRLAAALGDIDAFARRYLVPVAKRRLTRIAPVIMVAPAARHLMSGPAPSPLVINTS